MTKWLIFGFLALAGFAQAQSLTLTHVHGLAWSADGKRLLIPSHHGLAVYENGKWSKAPGPQHDFMGFAATARHLYSSGHPAHGSGFTNPFGLVRSKDGGQTWEKLALEGETDFHLLATGWNTNAIYVWNPEPSSRMRRTGLHCTFDEGRAWKSVRAAGLEGEPHALAVHPNDPKTVAVATSSGSRRLRAGCRAFRCSSTSTARIFSTAPTTAGRCSCARRSARPNRESSACRRSETTRWPMSRKTLLTARNMRSRRSNAACTCRAMPAEAGR